MSIFFLVVGIVLLCASSFLIGFLVGVEKTSNYWKGTISEYQKVISMYTNIEKERKEQEK